MPEFTTDSDTSLPDDVAMPEILKDKLPEVRAFFRGYVEAILWANVTWEGENGKPPEGYGNGDIELTEEQLRELSGDVVDFVEAQLSELDEYARKRERSEGGWFSAWEAAGRDFALTRNGHGAGFWDRGLGDLGERLKRASKPYGEAWIDATVEDNEIKTWIQ